MSDFKKEVESNIERLGAADDMRRLGIDFLVKTADYRYSYNFSWLGRPIIQYPQDMIAMQEIIWNVRPDLIIETGIAHGGSLIFYASILEMLAIAGHSDGRIIGIDIDIREHNRAAIESHSMYKRIEMIQGSSISPENISKIKERAQGCSNVMVVLDSNHTHEHVMAELEAYAPLVSAGSYCVVFDTVVEDMPQNSFPGRPWGVGDNPKTAVWEFLKKSDAGDVTNAQGEVVKFAIDKSIEHKLLVTVAPDGYLKRIE
jgi:cephalosporin hydroxylase